MRRYLLSIVAVTALLAPSAVSAAEIYGVWVREGHPTDKLEFFDCAGKLCAKGILPMLDGSPPPLVLRHAPKTGPNSWKGDLFNPEDGKTYTGKIAYDPATNQLTLTGCLVAFLCQSETWTRVSGPTAKPAADAKGDAHDAAKAGDKGHEAAKSGDKGHETAKPAAQEGAKGAEKAHDASKTATPDAAKTAKPAKPGETKTAPAKTGQTKPPAPKSGDHE